MSDIYSVSHPFKIAMFIENLHVLPQVIPNLLLVTDRSDIKELILKQGRALPFKVIYKPLTHKDFLKKTITNKHNTFLIILDLTSQNDVDINLLKEKASTLSRVIPVCIITEIYDSYILAIKQLNLLKSDVLIEPIDTYIIKNKIEAFFDIAATSNNISYLKAEVMAILNSVSESIITIDKKQQITYLNKVAKTKLTGGKNSILGANLFETFSFYDNEKKVNCAANIRKKLKNQQTTLFFNKIIVEGPTKERIIAKVTITPVLDFVPSKVCAVFTINDITEQCLLSRKVHKQSTHDQITGLKNRFYFMEQLKNSVKRCKKFQAKCAILIMGIDKFKNINEHFGHEYGDQLLKHFANRLEDYFPNASVIARLGGDEFIVLIENIDSLISAGNLAYYCIKSLKEPFVIEGNNVYITASIGIASYPSDGNSAKELLSNADAALYLAKHTGKAHYRFYDKSLQQKIEENIVLSKKLREAVDADLLEVYYQPQIDLQTKKIIGLEALVRWQETPNNFIPPALFIPIAEETGLIEKIHKMLFKKACKDFKYWEAHHYTENLKFSINISPSLFFENNFAPKIAKIATAANIPLDCIELEITESLFAKDSRQVTDNIRSLKEYGISLSLDDFGTGYSCLSYLKNLPIDTIKIDKSFIDNMLQNKQNMAIIKAIIELGENLEISILAEGVETKKQLDKLTKLGCNKAQGFFIAKPMPFVEVSTFLQNYT